MNEIASDQTLGIEVRSAIRADVDTIFSLVKSYAEMGNLLPRPKADVEKHIGQFFVAQYGKQVIGCGALEVFTPELAEIRSLVVAKEHKGMGFGRLLVERLIKKSTDNGQRRLMALTYVPEFFHQLGFQTVSKDLFPEKIWGICVNCYKFHRCDEIAVLKYL